MQCLYDQCEALSVDITVAADVEIGEIPGVLQERHHASNAIYPKIVFRYIHVLQGGAAFG